MAALAGHECSLHLLITATLSSWMHGYLLGDELVCLHLFLPGPCWPWPMPLYQCLWKQTLHLLITATLSISCLMVVHLFAARSLLALANCINALGKNSKTGAAYVSAPVACEWVVPGVGMSACASSRRGRRHVDFLGPGGEDQCICSTPERELQTACS